MSADVAIIGAGPVGLTLANLLGRRGHSVKIYEKQAEPYPQPRAIHFDGEVMRVFQATGLADTILPHTHVGRGMLFQDMAGNTLVDWSRDQETGPMGWFESYRFYQPGLEQALRDGLSRFDHVQLATSSEVASVSQTADGAQIDCDGSIERAQYVIGCDGATSLTRMALSSEMEDLGFNERWLVADLRLTRNRPDLGDHTIQYCDPDTPATCGRGVGDWRRWEVRLGKGDPDNLSTSAIWKKLERWITPKDAILERGAVYTFRSRVARDWGHGRIYIAGDAAHQMPPFMGQGMCAGIRDAANLGWKLSAVLMDTNPDILGTYMTERAKNVRTFIERSMALGRLINQTDTRQIPKGRMKSIWPDLGPGLGNPTQAGGVLAPQVQTDDGPADDVAKGEFYVLGRGSGVLAEFAGAEDWLRARQITGAVIRPDGYVLGGYSTDRECAALEDTARQMAPAKAR